MDAKVFTPPNHGQQSPRRPAAVSIPSPLSPHPRACEGRPKFKRDEGFHREMKRRVDDYFKQVGLAPRDNLRMFSKAVIVLLWFATSYLLLVFAANTWWQA